MERPYEKENETCEAHERQRVYDSIHEVVLRAFARLRGGRVALPNDEHAVEAYAIQREILKQFWLRAEIKLNFILQHGGAIVYSYKYTV